MDLGKAVEQRGDLVREGRIPDVLGLGPLDLRSLGRSEDEAALDMTALLRRLLVGRNDKEKTWAQVMAEGWVVDALEGSPKAIEDIFDRIDKGRLAGASAAAGLPPLDDETACKILEVLSGSGGDAMGEWAGRAGPQPPTEGPTGA
jgi:hypothetical protein